ncbi:MAG TPA: hypothetical protein VLG37_01405 [Candidatus Saccharimonadales bacterium]|nr:hypothetical protein [Candidatus Saccharimonadales bacterium]
MITITIKLLVDGVFFHPGDGKELADLEVKNVALPITGPDISMLDAYNFAKQLKAELVIPIHYLKFGAKPEVFKAYAEEKFHFPFKVRVLADGESTEL